MANPFAKKLGISAETMAVGAVQESVAGSLQQTIPSVTPAPAPTTRLGNMFARPKPVEPAQEEILDLASLDSTEDEGIVPVETTLGGLSQFEDETPATAPTRTLPEGMTPEQTKSLQSFLDLIDGVYTILHDPELLGNVIRSIMIELKANPQYMRQVADDDIRTWVRAMRDSMGLARIKKQESKTTRGSGAGKSKSKAVDSDMLDAFNDLGIDVNDL